MANLPPEQISQIVLGAVKDFTAYFEKLAEERRQNPGSDVATILATATIDGEPLEPLDLAGYYIIVAAAGHDTTSASTAGAMLALARDPEQFARVKADRNLVAGIVEEAIRWTTPVQHFMRMANEDVEIAGVKIAKGDWLMINYVAANHDPAAAVDELPALDPLAARHEADEDGHQRHAHARRRRALAQRPQADPEAPAEAAPRAAGNADIVRRDSRPFAIGRTGRRAEARQFDLCRRAQDAAIAVSRELTDAKSVALHRRLSLQGRRPILGAWQISSLLSSG